MNGRITDKTESFETEMPNTGRLLECHKCLLFMDHGLRARFHYQTALIQARLNLNVAKINLLAVEWRIRRKQRRL